MKRPQTLLPLALMLLFGLLGLFLSRTLAFNFTPSLPLGVYHRVDSPLEPGGLVAICLPEHIAQEARRQGILKAGECPGRVMPLLKRIAAVEGDTVDITPEGVVVAGQWIQPPAPARKADSPALSTWPEGHYVLTSGQLWLTATHPRSWDSRYFGPVAVDAVRGTYLPLWTWNP